MFRKTVIAALLIGSTIVVPSAMAAEETGWYAGASLGGSSVDIDGDKWASAAVAAGFASATATTDKNDTVYKIFAGYQVNSNFAIEAGYADLGKASILMTTTGPDAAVTGEFSATVWEASLVGTLPINSDFTAFGKLGFYKDDAKAKIAAISGGEAISASADSSGNGTKFGAGLDYKLDKKTALRFEFERYQDVGDADTTGETNVDVMSLGMITRF